MDIEAERAAIEKAVAEHAEATNRGGRAGAEGYASGAAPDARWLPPDAPEISGREAIADYAAEFTEMPGFHMSWVHPVVEVANNGEFAYSVGTYSGGFDDADGEHQVLKGKLVNIWKKQPDGAWKVAVAIWNTDEPAPPL